MYFQQQLEGQPYAAVFVADRRRAVLIGLTRQLIGEPSFHARPFHYCGSIGPLPIQRNLLTQLTRLGDTLTAEFGLLGLFGVDGMIIDGEFWVIEVNPRYTASVEILELGMELSVLSLHRDACTTGKLSSNPAVCATRSGKYIGKAILFAAETINVPDLSTVFAAPVRRSASRWSVPSIADIPQDGEQIPAGRPLCTVFAIASSVNSCQCALTAAAQMVYEQLKVSPSCSRPA
jgi:predicted ATP-grasp superfamily ATP-dependent carboligase